jgi:hypothetical protein
MPVIQVAPGPSGGGGDATAANQTTQIGIANSQQNTAAVTNTLLDNTSTPSVFKENITGKSVFQDVSGNQSLFFKTLENTNALANPNQIQCVSFTNITAAGVANDLSVFLAANNCFICGLTATQGGGTHDLYLLYST